MAADEAEIAGLGAGQQDFHLHPCLVTELDLRLERLIRIGIPAGRRLHHQALERQIVQHRRPASPALYEHGGGVEGDALKTATLVGCITHSRTPVCRSPNTIAKAAVGSLELCDVA